MHGYRAAEIRILSVDRGCECRTLCRVCMWALRRVACTDLTSSGYRVTKNGYSGTLIPEIGYTRAVLLRNRVQWQFGQSAAVLGVFSYLILCVPDHGYNSTGYTRFWLFPNKKYRSTELVKPTTTW